MPVAAYPLRLRPLHVPKVWGAETWLLADLATTSLTGAGGMAMHSVVDNGPLAGRTLREADAQLAGGLVPGGGPHPLLVKRIEAREHLSVQVHPSEAYAARHPDAVVKHESWIVTRADADATLFLGLTPGTSAATFAAAARAGSLRPLLRRWTPEVGACYTLPSGLVHALGGGVEVIEVQTASDTTFRLDDWRDVYDRPERELHVERAIEAALPTIDPVLVAADAAILARTAQYEIRRLRLAAHERHTMHAGEAIHVQRGGGTWHEGTVVTALDTFLIPAGLSGEITADDDGLDAIVIASAPH